MVFVMINLRLETFVILLGRAVNLYKDKTHLNKIIKKGMKTDHSWERVCQEYIDMYNLIINKR